MPNIEDICHSEGARRPKNPRRFAAETLRPAQGDISSMFSNLGTPLLEHTVDEVIAQIDEQDGRSNKADRFGKLRLEEQGQDHGGDAVLLGKGQVKAFHPRQAVGQQEADENLG